MLTWWMVMTPGTRCDQMHSSSAGQGAHLVDDDELGCIRSPIGGVSHENLEQVVGHPPQVVQAGLEVAIGLVVALQVHLKTSAEAAGGVMPLPESSRGCGCLVPSAQNPAEAPGLRIPGRLSSLMQLLKLSAPWLMEAVTLRRQEQLGRQRQKQDQQLRSNVATAGHRHVRFDGAEELTSPKVSMPQANMEVAKEVGRTIVRSPAGTQSTAGQPQTYTHTHNHRHVT